MNLKLFVKVLSEDEKIILSGLLKEELSHITPFDKWIESNRQFMSTRLLNALLPMIESDMYLERFSDSDLLKFRNFGTTLLKEFHKIKDKNKP